MKKIFFVLAAAALCSAPCQAQAAAPIAASTQTVVGCDALSHLFARAEELLNAGVKPLVIFDIDNTVLVCDR